MISGQYEFLDQDRVVFGIPAAQAVLGQSSGAKRIFIVASNTLSKKTAVVEDIRRVLGEAVCGVFDECVEHVPRSGVVRLVEVLREIEPDLIVTIGGGTPIDTVKLALLCLAEGISAEHELDAYRIRVLSDGSKHVPRVGAPPVRQIAIPTTLSGAEFSNLAGCSDPVRQVKDLYTGREIGAQVVILDPAVTIYTPDWLWLSTGVRALDHAVETVCSRAPQPFTDATCLHAISILDRALRRIKQEPNDMQARLDCQLGVWLASTGLGRVEWGASHGIGHQLGAIAGVAYGYTSCIMLHNVLRFNYECNADRQHLVAQALGSSAAQAADLIANLVRSLSMPLRLRDVGVDKNQLTSIAQASLQNMMVRSNPRPIKSEDEVLFLLEQAW